MERRFPKPGEIYRHFKGNEYEIVTMAKHTETNELCVVYRNTKSPSEVYVRPLTMFLSPVNRVKYPDAMQANRFELIAATSDKQENDRIIMEFLDANDYEGKLAVLDAAQRNINDEMLTVMAASLDIDVTASTTEEMFATLKKCLLTMMDFEGARLR